MFLYAIIIPPPVPVSSFPSPVSIAISVCIPISIAIPVPIPVAIPVPILIAIPAPIPVAILVPFSVVPVSVTSLLLSFPIVIAVLVLHFDVAHSSWILDISHSKCISLYQSTILSPSAVTSCWCLVLGMDSQSEAWDHGTEWRQSEAVSQESENSDARVFVLPFHACSEDWKKKQEIQKLKLSKIHIERLLSADFPQFW